MNRANEVIDGLVKGLETFAKLEASRFDGRSLIDNRFGFEFAPPDSSWQRAPFTAPLPSMSAGLWRKGNAQLLIMAVQAGDTRKERWLGSFLEQEMAARLGWDTLGAPERDALTIAGRASRRLKFRGASRVEVIFVPRAATYYVILVGGGPLEGADGAECAKGLKLLD
jgi:hypothetical protein